MAKTNSQPVLLRLLPSLTDFAFLLPLAFLFGKAGGTRSLLADGDTGWHVRTGEWILRHGHVPQQDIFSYTRPNAPWFAWEWLWDVIFGFAYQKGGMALVVLLNAILIGALIALLYRFLCRYATPVVALMVACTAAMASAVHWLARPHLVSLLFAVVFLWMLERVEEGNTRLLWALPPLTVLWTNLHGGFFVGVILVGAFAMGQMVAAVLTTDLEARSAAWRRSGQYLLCAAACMASSLVNPYFYKLHVHIVEYLTDSFAKEHILEFFSPNFRNPTAIFFEALLFGGVCAGVWHASRRNYRALILTAVWGHAALLSVRNVPLCAIIVSPYVAGALDYGLRRIPDLKVAGWLTRTAARLVRKLDDIGQMEAVGRWHLISAGTVAIIGVLVFAPAPPRSFLPEYDSKSYPEAALKALNFGPEARIFTNDEWGDYLIYRLCERGTKVFVDGRSDFYGREFEEKYLEVVDLKYGWEKTLSRYGVNTILLPVAAPMTGALKESSRWRVVYDDGMTLVFRPVAAAASASSQVSAAPGGGRSRDREITKTEARDRTITAYKTKPTI